MKQFSVSELEINQRLDVFLVNKIKDVSRSFVKRLCDMQKIEVNGSVESANYRLKLNDKITLNFDFDNLKKIPAIDLPLLYEDEDCVVIDKPAGILTHSKGNFNPEATVATWLEPKTIGMTGSRVGIVHRLDRATSGIMICAKNPTALVWLQKQFSARKVKKTYIAVVEGKLDKSEAIIDMPIERHPTKPKIFRVGENGRNAIAEYSTLKFVNGLSEIEIKPQTGRTHQIRVHLKQIGHPILGDNLYGGKDADRLYLHAKTLELTLPNLQRKVFESKIPPEFEYILR